MTSLQPGARIRTRFAPALAALALACSPGRAEEPLAGGPCEGCEAVFQGLPAELASSARLAPRGEPGAPMVIEGTVRSAGGTPRSGIVVYAYHTDAAGIYPRDESAPGAAARRHGRLRGWAVTGPAGGYRFDTIRPGAYPGRGEPQHVHMHVIEPGRCTYYLGDLLFEDDPRLTAAHRRRAERARGGPGLATPVRDDAGVWRVRRDIVLGEEVPGYEQTCAGRNSGAPAPG